MKTFHRAPLAVLADFEVLGPQIARRVSVAVRHEHLKLDQLDVDLPPMFGALQEFRVLPLAAVGEPRHDAGEAVRGHPLHQALDGDRARCAGSRFLAEAAQGFDQAFAAVELDPFQSRGSRHRYGGFDPRHRVLARLLAADLQDAHGKGHVEPVEDDPVAAQVVPLIVEASNFECLLAGRIGEFDLSREGPFRDSPDAVAAEEELDCGDRRMDDQSLDLHPTAEPFAVLAVGWNDADGILGGEFWSQREYGRCRDADPE